MGGHSGPHDNNCSDGSGSCCVGEGAGFFRAVIFPSAYPALYAMVAAFSVMVIVSLLNPKRS